MQDDEEAGEHQHPILEGDAEPVHGGNAASRCGHDDLVNVLLGAGAHGYYLLAQFRRFLNAEEFGGVRLFAMAGLDVIEHPA